jgi:hypothetical protein
VLASANGRGYMFRLDVDSSADEIDLKSDAFSKEPNADMVLSSQGTQLLTLNIPNASQ